MTEREVILEALRAIRSDNRVVIKRVAEALGLGENIKRGYELARALLAKIGE